MISQGTWSLRQIAGLTCFSVTFQLVDVVGFAIHAVLSRAGYGVSVQRSGGVQLCGSSSSMREAGWVSTRMSTS